MKRQVLLGLVLTLALVNTCLGQKLFFRRKQMDAPKGFGLKNAPHYYTARRTALEMAAKVSENAVVCPGNQSACPDGNTCCMMINKAYGCCPLPQASCCQDGRHCCPMGMKCDLLRQACTRDEIFMSWIQFENPSETVVNKHVEVKQVVQEAVVCPDGQSQCPSGNTCCMLSSGQYGCCPIDHAVCCSDHLHCCPEDTTCDVSQGKCIRGNELLDWFEKQPAITVKNVMCDDTHECPSGNTCCKLASGEWGCCPISHAVCCSDHVHCCPEDTTCDVSEGKCIRGNELLDWFEKQPAITVKNVRCDDTHACPSGNTCCKLASGEWGCCPISHAVCCSDHVHCCPEDTTCDVSQGKCNRGNEMLDWFEKQPAITLKNVMCDDTHACPSGNTCCKLASGEWGCCPISHAVCCSDHVHCCPEDTTCDVSQGKCNRGNELLDWFEKQPAITLKNVMCDDTHECPSGNTCCKLASGEWGCCPISHAVCCSDHVHCCPEDTTCDVSQGKCNRGNELLDWFEKTPVIKSGSELVVNDVICPDGSECKDGETCCQMSKSQTSYGCCPLPNAVCCSDGLHCCPNGYKCNVAIGFCVKGFVKLPWITTKRHASKMPTVQLPEQIPEFVKVPGPNVQSELDLKYEPQAGPVKCGDGSVSCPEDYSCCDNGKGSYNCCPMPKGVCCADHVYCCPHGYICGEEPATCRIPEVRAAASNFLQRLLSKEGKKLI